MRLAGKTALITATARGIGRAFANAVFAKYESMSLRRKLAEVRMGGDLTGMAAFLAHNETTMSLRNPKLWMVVNG
ncbi:hypothetical protein N4R57_04280 [Rhodobacteraceae bacterium D3-12]|nr:hypothetical protein N4R57_04280 [Rhodobacteraceae bacterium D3-12]